MRRTFALATTVAAVLVLVAAMPAAAGTRQAITIHALTSFSSNDNPFTSTGLGTACEVGTVANGDVHVEFQRGTNVFAGYKVFTCDANTGFTLRLNARFGGFGSVGTWAVVDAWGAVAGISGAGSIVGTPMDNGIIDDYSGTITR